MTAVSRDSTDAGRAASAAEPSSDGLAPVYRRVLALHDAGLSDEAIAVILGVTCEAVPSLIDVAARKHSRRSDDPRASGGGVTCDDR